MSHSTNSLPRIAWLSPFPPQRSGIANYSYWLITALKPYFNIDLYYDTQAPASALQNQFDVYPLSVFPEHHQNYDEVIYHLGNHIGFHKEIYKLPWRFPATVVLHDYNLGAFMYDAFYRQNDEYLYRQALLEGYGDEGRLESQALAAGRLPDSAKYPMSHAVAGKSRKVIVHHRWVKNQLGGDHVEVIPLFYQLERRPTLQLVEERNNFYVVAAELIFDPSMMNYNFPAFAGYGV